jgi:NIMA (never in mitosis gene a)-related kinase
LLGRGAAGSVELVRRSNDGELFALKTIQMQFMNPSERKLAENEISLLKVLKGPTIIRYFDSFIESDAIHIVMEYAEGGALSDIITEHKTTGKSFTKKQIMDWYHIV